MNGVALLEEKVSKIKAQQPARGTIYYYVAAPYFTVQKEVFCNSRLDHRLMERNNFFTSEERAKQFAEKMLQFLATHNESKYSSQQEG